jgi:protocatechuate 3,4-dioxygenase beta subunit
MSHDSSSLYHPSRRVILGGALAAGSLTLVGAPIGEGALAQGLSPTPECRDGDEPTQRQMDGPFYKPSSPERDVLVERNAKARVVELTGTVLSRSCKGVPRVLVDLWHADEAGDYDNKGFRYRGHVFTDADGRFRFRTIQPALYPGRTRHYHVKVLSTGRALLTTQLYFPNEPMNARDSLYRRALELRTADAGDAMAARFDFVLDVK